VAGVIIALFGTTLPAAISHSVGITAFPGEGVNPVAIAFGICLLIGGLVARAYERNR
jgi:hypothetical protein